jgi:cyclophilin family peptidyl-prolyl cis-trans isomerase
VLIICVVVGLAACGGNSKKGGEASKSSASSSSQQPVPGGQSSAAAGCKPATPPPAHDGGNHKPPKGELDRSKTWSLVVDTNCGSFTIALDPKIAPHTTASLVSLAKGGFYNGTTFHRIVPNFVIQGGDPTGTGNGGPGYKTVDKPPSGTTYEHGVVAMAKTESEKPGTAGSQFFVVTGQDAGLPPQYAVVGRVVDGLDVVERIGRLGDPATEQPTQPVVMTKVTVKNG